MNAACSSPRRQSRRNRSPEVPNSVGRVAQPMTPIESVNAFFDRGAQLIHLKDEMYDVLKTSYREVQEQVTVRMDDGSLQVFTGYTLQHNGARGPYRGAVRYHPQTDLDQVQAVAALMTWKTAPDQSPVGGREG